MLDLSSLERSFAQLSFGTDQRLRAWKKISVMLRNKVGIDQILAELYDRASEEGKKPRESMAIVYDEWRKVILNGGRFSDAIEGWVPALERMIIMAGEQSGNLPKAFDSVIAVVRAGRKIRNAVVGGLLYPTILIAATIAYLFLFGLKVVPEFTRIIDPANWGPAARSLYLLSEFTIHYGPFLIGGIIAAVTGIVLTLPRWTGDWRVRADRLPPWSLYRLVVGAGFMQSLAALLSGGGRIKDSLQSVGQISTPYLRERVDGFLLGINSGLNAGDAMRDSGYDFPSKEIVGDLGVYARHSGDFGSALESIASEWMETGLEQVQQQMGLLKGMAIAVIALALIWILVGFFAIQMEIGALARGAGA